MGTGEQQPPLGLEEAYAVETPADNLRLYARWAETYEHDFIAAKNYQYHLHVADALVDGPRPDGPVLDVGCGTGIVGTALRERGVAVIDGVDISPEMLGQAAAKDQYRDLVEADLTVGTPIADGVYAGITSSGTFTHGHLPPEPLGELIRIAKPGARCAIGVNAAHYEEFAFGDWLDRALADARIEPYEIRRVKVYADSDPDRLDDMSNVVVFTVC
jgi:SAM-dependent methyltransferase